MNADCLISVVIPCYNGANTLARAVRSVVAQNVPSAEIIIVDDQSMDDSVAVAVSLAVEFAGVRSIQQPVNSGPAAARNQGLRHARGRYVCFLDADDEYAPGFFTTVLPILERDGALAWVSTGIELVNCRRDVHPIQLHTVAVSLPSNLIVRKAAADLVGGFPESPVFRGKSAGEDIAFRTALKRWFNGAHRAERFLRYWTDAAHHLHYFLDRSKVVKGELVFTSRSPDETNGDLIAAQKEYFDQARQRVSVLASFKHVEEVLPQLTDRILGAADEFDVLRARFDSVAGFLHPQEGYALCHFARHGPGRGAIVEIGSFCGRSTCWLAAGTCAAGREKVVAVDHFRGSPEHQENGSHPIEAIAQTGTTLPTFIANLQKHGLRHWVDVRVGGSSEIGGAWNGPIRLLFIDGDHSYEAADADVRTWSKHVVSGGVMAFHDVDVWPGVTKLYREFLAAHSAWREVSKVRSLRIVHRQN